MKKTSTNFIKFKDTYNGTMKNLIRLYGEQYDVNLMSELDEEDKEMFGILADTMKLSAQALDLYEESVDDLKSTRDLCETQSNQIRSLTEMVRDLQKSIDKMEKKG